MYNFWGDVKEEEGNELLPVQKVYIAQGFKYNGVCGDLLKTTTKKVEEENLENLENLEDSEEEENTDGKMCEE